ncbi:hypothetical protein PSYG_00067 [Psychrobacter phage pOW20-A]|uniref:baseplate wedge subunit n=1 Tax=Psychrobacter phage pOW20-A TaxID=754048 RepID=UPI0002C18E3A|nr:baseplate wedge subunit [Psychrobacter phage pOW20-A]AGH57528.1 hypothetical protein PSYG_00067 [Psychrobacter phage pOW20-A]
MTQLTDTGFERTRLIDRLAEIQGDARSIFGQDIDLSSDTMDGQHISLFAEAIADLDELAELVWMSFDPDLAFGNSLSRLVKINGIERSQGAYSIVNLTVTGTPLVLIPKGSSVSNASGTVEVYTTEDVRIDETGTAIVEAMPESMGAISASADTLTVIKSPLFGWSSVTNADSMVTGKLRETDQQLRERRRGSVSKGNRNMTEALWAKLSDLSGVIEVSVLENATQYTDSRGLPPHSIHVVISGGDEAQIAETIWASKTGGTLVAGTEEYTIIDEVGNEQVMRFSRPVDVTIKVAVYITPLSGYSFSTASLIKQAVLDYMNDEIAVGGDIINSALYTPLNEIGGFAIERIELAKGNEALAEKSIYLEFNERISISTNNVEVI